MEVPEPPPGDEEAVAPQAGVPSCLPGEVFNPATGICEVTPSTDSADQLPNNGGKTSFRSIPAHAMYFWMCCSSSA